VINLPAREVRPAHVPFLALAVGSQDERPLARPHQNSHLAHTKVALKTIRPELADHPEVLERFKREIHLARKVTHPSVCRIFDLGYHADSTGRKLSFFTMELLYGETLADRIGRLGRMTAAEALPIVEQMAAGLQAAHDEGIVHRDFKSSNVLLIPAPEGSETPFRAKITDFGLARAVERTETMFSTITGSAALVGTPAYMAPEQVEGLEITAQADIYALGVVMFEMVTGTLPFSGPSPSAVAVKRLTEPPPSPKVRVPYLDPRWDRVILGCMEKIPADRYASAMEVSTALQEGTKARRKSSRAVAGTGSRRKYIVAGVAGLILLVSAAIFALRHHYRSLPTPPASSAGEAEHYGWRRSALPGEARLPDLSAAAASDDKEITLFGASMLRTWQPGEKEMPSLQTGLVLAGNADCPWGTWLVHDDHRHLTSWNLADHRAIKTITLPWAIRAAGCLDDKQDRWLFLLHDEPPSRLIEFNVNSGQNLREMKLPASLLDMALDPARKVFMLMGENDISERSVADFGELFHDELDEGLLKGVAFQWSGSGRYFASGRRHLVIYDLLEKKRINSIAMAGWALAGWIGDDALSAMDDHGRLYWTSNIRKGWQLQQEPPAKGTYDRLLWLPEQWRWVAIDNHGTGLSWQYETPSLFHIAVSPTEIWSVAANQSGTMVAVSGKDPAIHIVDVQQPKVVRTLEGHTDGVTKVSFDSHDRLISGSDDGTLRVWDPADGKLLNTVNAHKNLINSFALSPDGEWLVSVSSDRTVKMWRMPNLDFVAEVATTRNSGAAVAFLPGENERFLVGDWAGWLYSFQRKRFRLEIAGRLSSCRQSDLYHLSCAKSLVGYFNRGTKNRTLANTAGQFESRSQGWTGPGLLLRQYR
jgi:serine/threonine protein kinase